MKASLPKSPGTQTWIYWEMWVFGPTGLVGAPKVMKDLPAFIDPVMNPVQGAEFTERTGFCKEGKYHMTLLPNHKLL